MLPTPPAGACGTSLTRRDAWNGLEPGDPVRIAGIRGGHWRYRCHVTNPRNGEAWVEVAELDVPRAASGAARASRAGSEQRTPPVRRVRSFAEDRVVPLRKARRRARSLPIPGQGTLDLGLPPSRPAEPPLRSSAPRRPRAARPPDLDAPRLPLWPGPEDGR